MFLPDLISIHTSVLGLFGGEVAIAMAIAQAAAMAMMAVSQAQAASAAKQQGRNQMMIAQQKQRMQERQALQERQASQEEAKRFEKQAAELQGKQVSVIGKSGTDFSGDSLMVLSDTAKNLELDRLNIIRDGELRAQRAEQEGAVALMEGKSAKQYSNAMARSYQMGMAGSILSGTGTFLNTANEEGWLKTRRSKQLNTLI